MQDLLPAYQNSNIKAFQNIQRRKSWCKLYLCNPTLVLHRRTNLIVPKTHHSQACNVLNHKNGRQFERKGKNKQGITKITGNNKNKEPSMANTACFNSVSPLLGKNLHQKSIVKSFRTKCRVTGRPWPIFPLGWWVSLRSARNLLLPTCGSKAGVAQLSPNCRSLSRSCRSCRSLSRASKKR